MIVTGAVIDLSSGHSYSEESQHSESLQVWAAGEAPPSRRAASANTPDESSVQGTSSTQNKSSADWSEFVAISTRGQVLAKYRQSQSLDMTTGMDARARQNLLVLQAFYEAITGHKMRVLAPDELAKLKAEAASADNVDQAAPQVDIPPLKQPMQSTGGLIYQRQDFYRERESLAFSAQGEVHTADGRVIAISAQLNLSREYVEQSNLEIRAGDALKMDPLVINFDGKGAELSQTKFAFDLDANGTSEQIASLRSGSGYLALDRNGDGQINNGTELFGPQSGSGFGELAAYDEDANGFIDEADSVYSRLRIWTRNEDGSSQLFALGDKQVGAIYLGHLNTGFQLKDNNNNSLGEVAASGIYLKEDGGTGWVQEINLTV